MITVESINEKLNFDFREFEADSDVTMKEAIEYHYPFMPLSQEERDFILEYKTTTVDSINSKLGFDFRTWKSEADMTIEDDRDYGNPFTILTYAELEYLSDYRFEEIRNKEIIENINSKLDFDFRKWKVEEDIIIDDNSEYDRMFRILNEEELDFIMNYDFTK